MRQSECKKETKKHIKNVNFYIRHFCKELLKRGMKHDASKLHSPELEIFTEFTPKLKDSTYGSEEYKGFLKSMKVALKHHYDVNRHHPEHFHNGINDMNLIDLVEMLCDWKSATLRHNNGDLLTSIEINQKRFGYDDGIKQLLINTAKDMCKYRCYGGCVDGTEWDICADTVEDFHKRIDERDIREDFKDILKNGYFNEFKKNGYKYETQNYCIDNGFDVYWVVKDMRFIK